MYVITIDLKSVARFLPFILLTDYFIFKIMCHGISTSPHIIILSKLKNKIRRLESVNKKLSTMTNKIQDMQEVYENFINLIPDGVLILKDKKIRYVNSRLLDMFQIDNKANIENINILEIIKKTYHEIYKSRIYKMKLDVLEKPQEYELIWQNKIKWIEANSLIVNDEDEKYIICVIRDIEDRKKAEEIKQVLLLKEKEELMKNDFFANISHELRTPINVIYSALQLENQCLIVDDSKKQIIKYNKIIRQNCLRLIRLINNIIDITRIKTSSFKPEYKIQNIVSIVENITMEIVGYIKSKDINLIFDTEIEEAYVNCDLNLIERIMLNLLSNAIKYGKKGGNIEVCIYEINNYNITILVKDDGIGIPEDMQHKVFDKFQKVDNSFSRRTEGSGIGLYIVKQLVEVHSGTITCNSKLNKGTEFEIVLPTVEYSEAYTLDTRDNINNYVNNEIKSTEIEFSDIY